MTCIVRGHQDARGVEIKPIADRRFVDPRCEVLGDVDDPEQRVSTLTGRQGTKSARPTTETEWIARISGRENTDEIRDRTCR